jgi:insecticidal toxin complex protein TccC
VSWDEDDTVTRSPYYEQHIHDPDLPPAERAALEMAARLADTPSTTDRDVLGRDIRLTTLLVSSEAPDPSPPRALHTVSFYDALDNVTAYADPRFYDPEDPARPRFFNAFIRYDMRGRPAWQKSADAGNLPLRVPGDGLPWIRLFDALDGSLDEWDRRGFRTTIEYDVLRLPTGGRLRGDGFSVLAERIVYGNDPSTNTVHRIIEQDDQAGVERTSLYSILGDPISRSRQFRVAAEGVADWEDPTKPVLQPVVWAWITRGNALGEPVYYQAPNGATVSTAYTNNGWQRLVTLGGEGAELSAAAVTRFSPAGLPATLVLGNGFSVERSYEPATLRLSAIRAADRDEVVRQDIAYTYDPVGNVTDLENRVPIGGGPAPESGVYRYDSLYHLISAAGRRQASGGGAVEPYSRSYRLDDSGNLTEVVDAAGPAWSRKYAISPSANHAITEAMTSIAPPDAFYDADGLLTALPDGTTLGYNPGGQLARAERTAGGKSLFQYTGSGVRARKKTEIGETYYLEPFLSEGTPEDPAEITLSLGDEMIAVARYAGAGLAAAAPAVTYQLTDRLHSVVERTDAGGRRLDQQTFYPYGATAIHVPANGGELAERRYQFTGQERDPSTGLYAFAKRYYSTDLSRWIAPDPAGTIDGINLFTYVNGNPLTLQDPTGECGKDGDKAPSTTENVKQLSKTFNKYGVYTNVIGEVLSGQIHLPPLLNLAKNSPFLTAYQIKAGNIAGFGGVFGGVFGSVYSAFEIKKNGLNFFTATFLVGQLAFAYEGYQIYKALGIGGAHAFHAAHMRIGYIGFVADVLKIPYYVKSKEYGEALFYGGLALGNLRNALPDKAVLERLNRLFTPVVRAYARSSSAARFPSSTRLVSGVPKALASVKGPHILGATFLAKTFFDYLQSSNDKR